MDGAKVIKTYNWQQSLGCLPRRRSGPRNLVALKSEVRDDYYLDLLSPMARERYLALIKRQRR